MTVRAVFLARAAIAAALLLPGVFAAHHRRQIDMNVVDQPGYRREHPEEEQLTGGSSGRKCSSAPPRRPAR